MSEPFVGEIRMFAGNFSPRGWAFCEGQLLAVSQNDALFSLLGTIYGGDGRTTFGLPDLRGRCPIHQGHGGGLSSRRLGAKFGTERETLTVNQMPNHYHTFNVLNETGASPIPTGNTLGTTGPYTLLYSATANTMVTGNISTISYTGGSQSHTNMQPFLAIYFIIALFGIYPSRH